jgi:hypothetical protein
MELAKRGRLRAAPGRNVAQMQAAERRLTEKLASFFAVTAPHVSRQISAHLGHNDVQRMDRIARALMPGAFDGTLSPLTYPADDGVTILSSDPKEEAYSLARRVIAHELDKGSDHANPDLHVKPENAIPINLASVDVVTQANVQHVSWELVREGQTQTARRKIAIADLIATQKVVDRERLAKHIEQLRETGELDKKWPPLVLLWDGDFFLLSGHHGAVAAKALGWIEIPVDVMSAE